MNLIEKLQIIRDIALSVGVPSYHYLALKKPNQYIVWAEDNQSDSLQGDNITDEQVIQGTLDYYTKGEYDMKVEKIQEAFNNAEISWRLNSIQFEEETSYIHYEWVWSL